MANPGNDLYNNLFLNREQTIRKINDLGREKAPFLFVIDFDMNKGLVLRRDDPSFPGILNNFSGPGNEGQPRKAKGITDLKLFPVDFETYTSCFEKVKYHLNRGDTYLINLTFPTKIITGMTPEEIYSASCAPYKILVPGNFVCFSPETFIKIEEDCIRSFPMKGTIDSSVENAEEKILGDRKELYEHNTIVDLIRNDLSMVSSGVEVTRFRYVEKVSTCRKNLLQVSSEIRGMLAPGWRQKLGEILFTLLPAGSVTGAPKERTVGIIRETEIYNRNFYTGISGYFDGESLDSAVLIRFIEFSGGEYLYKSGGGITALSRAEDEYNEMIDKVYVPVI